MNKLNPGLVASYGIWWTYGQPENKTPLASLVGEDWWSKNKFLIIWHQKLSPATK